VSDLGATNAEVIAEFRANGGKVGGFFARETLLLLTTIGRKSGNAYTTPLSYHRDGDDLIVIGANLASSRISDWYLNILASPLVTVEVANERLEARATVLEGERRLHQLARMQAAWDASRSRSPELPEFPVPETGEIPVVALRPIKT
jgi:deazaflavin-dependent oxidoreductase (nitroreductase family)